jgi:monovalent cation:H+ antiporter, CPA1 family
MAADRRVRNCVIAKRIGIPYTVALVLGGLLLSLVHLPALAPLHQGNRPDWLTPDVILTLFLPALLFEGSLKIELRHIRTDIVPLLLLANLGVLIATLVTGLVIYYAVGMSLIVALLFGSMVSATDPISVLSIFKEVAVEERLSVLVEGESLLTSGLLVIRPESPISSKRTLVLPTRLTCCFPKGSVALFLLETKMAVL